MKDFVKDAFFESGHWLLKIREVAMTLLFWLFLVLPIIVLINSLSDTLHWENFYYWTYADGFELVDFLESSIFLAFLVILLFSIYFLLRNNHYEKHVYPNQKTYDEKELDERKEILEKMYKERFGEKGFRESTKFYTVEAEQNIKIGHVEKLFKDKGVYRGE